MSACVRYYEEYGVEEGEVSVMLQLQDDPTELKAITSKWHLRRS